MSNQQIHKKFSDEQVIAILENYLTKEISAKEAMAKLELGRSQFFNLASRYRDGSDNFTVKHKGNAGNRKISKDASSLILKELKKEKMLIDNKAMPIKFYNYSAVKDALGKVSVSLPTIINFAKVHGYYLKKPERKIHDRVVLTDFIGELIQHDSSHHLFAPDGEIKWYLITSLDDYSRLLLYADLWKHESSFKHILSVENVVLNYGIPHAYYVDQHRIFRYVKSRDEQSHWVNYTKFTDDSDPQWKQVLKELKVESVYALSPQAKGKIERPYQWLQDHLVRTCVREQVTDIAAARVILKNEVECYNYRRVHSTTKEIPMVRFETAQRERRSLFREFKLEQPNQTVKDIFCLRETRVVNGYSQVHFRNVALVVANAKPGQRVDLKIYPDPATGVTDIRIWQGDTFIESHKVNRLM